MPQPKPNRKQKIKNSLTKVSAKLQQTSNAAKQSAKQSITKTKQKCAAANKRLKTSASNTTTRIKSIKFPKININLKIRKEKPEPDLPEPQRVLPKDVKVIDKYPLFEPFSQVAIVQDPKTGEHKYVLDELQLDPMERGIYNRILEILLQKSNHPKRKLLTRESSSLKKPKKSLTSTASASVGFRTFRGTRFSIMLSGTWWVLAKLTR